MLQQKFQMGSEVVVEAALAAGAEAFFGYPITPTTEILEFWSKEVGKSKKSNKRQLLFLQAEDEMAAGFALIGSCLAGKKSFTATAGPGNVLMQDAFSMAEAMRIPTVAIIGQRGGPSTGTVIYSQQEIILTIQGGHGEGHRIVYSPSSLSELYNLVVKAFNTAWRYHFPTFVLTDGYLLKTKGEVASPHQLKNLVKSKPLLEKGKVINLRNCYDLEEELFEVLEQRENDFEKIRIQVEEFEYYGPQNPKLVVLAHGIVAAAAKQAIDNLKSEASSFPIGLFRPITLRPFPVRGAKQYLTKARKILVVESSGGQFLNIVKGNLYGLTIPINSYLRPALGITPQEIVAKIKKESKL